MNNNSLLVVYIMKTTDLVSDRLICERCRNNLNQRHKVGWVDLFNICAVCYIVLSVTQYSFTYNFTFNLSFRWVLLPFPAWLSQVLYTVKNKFKTTVVSLSPAKHKYFFCPYQKHFMGKHFVEYYIFFYFFNHIAFLDSRVDVLCMIYKINFQSTHLLNLYESKRNWGHFFKMFLMMITYRMCNQHVGLMCQPVSDHGGTQAAAGWGHDRVSP